MVKYCELVAKHCPGRQNIVGATFAWATELFITNDAQHS